MSVYVHRRTASPQQAATWGFDYTAQRWTER